jgi:uncharacterized protein YggU (UPF0235/DUF167 family)
MSVERKRSPDAPPAADDLESAVTACAGGAAIAIRVVPRAGASTIAGTRNGALLVRLAAAPVEGAANAALVSLLARTLQTAPRNITITAGHHSRDKRLSVTGADPVAVRDTLSRVVREG